MPLSLILALDLGSKTGVCHNLRDKLNYSELDLKKSGKFSDGGFYCLHSAVQAISEQGKQFGMKVYAEKAHAGRFFAASRILFGLMAIVQMSCFETGCELVWVSPKTIKKYATGDGSASKEQMVIAANQLLGFKKNGPIKSHNVADSVCLWHYAQGQERGVQ